jgi:DNA-3-methyladenine glycosylase II
VCGQQVSVASAEAIWGRLAAIPEAITPHGFLDLGEHGLTGVGLSRPKFASLTAIAQAITAGTLDLDVIEGLPAQDAIDALVIHKGIGPWTAEVYLSFCSGHRDIFPSGDLALQKGAAEALGLELLPDRPTLSAIASAWAPYRSAAALLLWRYYASTRGRKAIPV